MSSIAAAEVAREVLDTVVKGERPILRRIAIRKGYSEATARGRAKHIVKTKSYQAVMTPIVQRWEKERERLMDSMEKENLTYVEYSDKAKVLDTLTKNIQLLSGGATANIAVKQIYNGLSIHGHNSNSTDILTDKED